MHTLPPALRNLDILPDTLCPHEGCPTCGGAFVELDAVGGLTEMGFTEYFENVDELDCIGQSLLAASKNVHVWRVSCARLLCVEGHEHETGQTPSWGRLFIGIGAMGVFLSAMMRNLTTKR